MAANDNTKTAAYENYPNTPLMGGAKTFPNTTQNTQNTQMVEVQGTNELSVEVVMPAAAAGDLTVTVYPVFADGSVSTAGLTPIRSTGPTFSGGADYFYGQYDVSGANRVVISCVNTTATPRNITINWSQSGG